VASGSYLDGPVVEGSWDAVREAVVALLHDGVVPPQLLLVPAVQQAAEDGGDADLKRQLKKRRKTELC
jgi:hypothetical protein